MKIEKIIVIGVSVCFAIAAAPMASADLLDPITDPIEDVLAEKVETYRSFQQAMADERKALAQTLKDKTPAERREAIRQYQAEKAEAIADHRALGEEIREAVKDLRPERNLEEQPLMAREEMAMPVDVKELMDIFKVEREKLLAERRQIIEENQGASQEDLRAALDTMRDVIDAHRQRARELQQTKLEQRESRRQ